MTGGTAHLLLAWLLPAACGAMLGFLLGFLALGRAARAVLLANRSRIGRAVSERAGSLASRLLDSNASTLVPGPGSPSMEKVRQALESVLAGILGSRGTIYAVRGAVEKLVEGIAGRGVSETAKKLDVERLLSDRLFAALAAESTRGSLAAAAGTAAAEGAGPALDDEAIAELAGVVQSAVPEAAEAAVRWLRSAETREDLSTRARELLPRILSKLTELQQLFLGAAQLDRRLNEKMPEIVDEIVHALEKMVRDPAQQERIVAVFSEAARGWRDSLRAGTAGPARSPGDRQQRLSAAVSSLVERFLARLEDPAERRALAARAAASLDRDRRQLGSFLRDQAGVREQEVTEAICDRVLRILTSPRTARELAAHLAGLVAARAADPQATVGSILGVEAAGRTELEALLRAAAPRVVDRALPAALGRRSTRRGLDLLLGAFGAGLGAAVGLALSALRAAGLP